MRSAQTIGAAATLALAVTFSARAQDRSAELLSALQLRPGQQAAYAIYLKSTAPDPVVEARRREEASHLREWTTPKRFDWTRAQAAADLAELDAEGPAVKRFYNQLTPAQQRTFDALTLPPPP